MYCGTDVFYLIRNVARATRRGYAPSVVKEERGLERFFFFSHELSFSANDPQVFYVRSFILSTSVNYLNLAVCILLGPFNLSLHEYHFLPEH